MPSSVTNSQRQIGSHCQHIRLTALLQHPSQRGIRAIQRIRQHPRAGCASIKRIGDEIACNLGFGRKCDPLGHGGLPDSAACPGSMLRQIQSPVDQRLAEGAGIGEEDANLAVFDPPGRAGVLSRYADGVGALFKEAGFIDHQHAGWIAQRGDDLLTHLVAQGISVPDVTTEQ